MIPNSRATFKDYCLRSLGAPVLEINVADEQTEDRIDEALQYYQMFHMDSVDRMVLTHVLTETDITNGYLTLVAPVISVIKVFLDEANSLTQGDFASDLWQYQSAVFGELGFTSTSGSCNYQLSDYAISMQNLSNIDMVLANYPTIRYSMHSNKLFIEDDISRFKVGSNLGYEAYVAINPTAFVSVWNDMWLKSFSIALIGRQWGDNLSKFQQVELPGGITLNGDAIYDKYNTRITELKEEMETTYSFPPDFMIG